MMNVPIVLPRRRGTAASEAAHTGGQRPLARRVPHAMWVREGIGEALPKAPAARARAR